LRQTGVLIALAVAGASATARAQPSVDVEAAVFVVSDKKVPSASHATLLGTFEKALRRDRRIRVVDKDRRLAQHGGLIPSAVISEARGLLNSGIAMLRRGRVGPALARLHAAELQLGRSLAFVSKQQLARAQFYIGVAEARLGKGKAAQKTFERLLVWRPRFVADTSLAPAKVLPLWSRAQRAVRKRKGGSLELTSAPAGALAYVDGRFVGFTPTTAEGLTIGAHYVTYRKLGYVRQVVEVGVSGSQQRKHRATMRRSPDYDRMRLLLGAVAAGSTEAGASEELTALGGMLGIEHAVLLEVSGSGANKRFEARLFQVANRKQLARVKARLAENQTIEALFAQMARSLYANVIFRPKPKPKPKKVSKPTPAGKKSPFYKRWWFWTGVSAIAATAITVPLLMRDGDSGPTCPGSAICGEVLLRF
jgi:hypothetical protein